jgi:hypothetical protein
MTSSDPPTNEPEAATADGEGRGAPLGRRRLGFFLLVGGGVLAAAQLLPRWPHERHLSLRLDDPSTVTSVDLAWTRQGYDGEPSAGSSWRFPAGKAPRRVEGAVKLPNGTYEVEITILRTDSSQTIHRSVALEGADDVVLPLR